MRIAIVGAGGVGGTLAVRLAGAGHEVWLSARGDHAAAIRERGLELRGHDGVTRAAPGALHLIGPGAAPPAPAELLVMAVKAFDLDEAADGARALLSPDTAILPLQNGIDAAERLRARVPGARVLGGTARVVANLEAPGVVRADTPLALVLGALDPADGEAAARAAEALAVPGVKVSRSEDIRLPLWTKFIFICGFSGMTTLCRTSIGPVLASTESAAMLEAIMREVEALAHARGIPLPPDVTADQLRFGQKMDPAAPSSMLGDLQRGKRLELDHLNGAAVRLAGEAGVPAPCNRAVVAALRPWVNGPPRVKADTSPASG
ncbi:MAG TPA: 2-dehydropantoate 2-reductase [Myxococcaceae bacterium]|jgi:2-dehydropantoate 2-reductase